MFEIEEELKDMMVMTSELDRETVDNTCPVCDSQNLEEYTPREEKE